MKSLGAARMAAMAAVTLTLIGFFSFLMIQMTTPQMVPLFTDLSVDDSASIIKDLERQAVPYQLKSDGAIIMVPKDKVARLRMKLAESGLPKGGGVGYEIFDKSDALGATTFVQNINHLLALFAASKGCKPRVSTSSFPSGHCFPARKSSHPAQSFSRYAAHLNRNRCAPSAIWSRPRSTALSQNACPSSTKPENCLLTE